MSNPITISQIAAALTGGEPLAYKAQDDGGLVIVAHTGQKFHFSAAQVAEMRQQLTPPPKKSPAKTSTKSASASSPAKTRSSSRSKASES